MTQTLDDEIGFATLVQGQIDGEDYWAYLAVKPSLYEEFQKKQKSGDPFRITDYGEVLAYKIGETEPDEETQDRMRARYGIDPDFEDTIENVAQEMIDFVAGSKQDNSDTV